MKPERWKRLLNSMDTNQIVSIYTGKLLDQLTRRNCQISNEAIEKAIIHGDSAIKITIEDGEMILKVTRLKK